MNCGGQKNCSILIAYLHACLHGMHVTEGDISEHNPSVNPELRSGIILSRKLKSRYGARNRFQEQSLESSSHATKAGGRYDNPMPTWFLAPIAGLMLPTQIPIRILLFILMPIRTRLRIKCQSISFYRSRQRHMCHNSQYLHSILKFFAQNYKLSFSFGWTGYGSGLPGPRCGFRIRQIDADPGGSPYPDPNSHKWVDYSCLPNFKGKERE